MAIQPSNGDIVLSGNVIADTEHDVGTVRLLPSGALDPGFGSGGIVLFAGYGTNAITLQGNGDIVLGKTGASAVRLLSTGAVDTSFGERGIVASIGSNDSANVVVIAPGGQIVLTGVATTSGVVLLTAIELSG